MDNLTLNRAVTVSTDVGNGGMPFQIKNHMVFLATGGVLHSSPFKQHFDVHLQRMKIVDK